LSLSRKHFERLGEPLGDCVTRPKVGGGYVCGGGGGGKSSSATTTTTNNVDRRLVVDGGIGISSDSSTIYVDALDGDIVNKALDFAAGADAIAGEGFMRLLKLTERLFDAGGEMLDKTSDNAMRAVEAVQTAKNDAQGSIDQKTMVILAAVGLGAAYIWKGR